MPPSPPVPNTPQTEIGILDRARALRTRSIDFLSSELVQ